MIEKPKGKGLFAWALYDWANQAYFTIIQTFVFATYFNNVIASDDIQGTDQFTTMVSLAGLCLAVLAPFLGSIADQAGRRKPWIGFFTALSVVSCALLWFSVPGENAVLYSLGVAFFATVGAEASLIFYSAMLPDLASKDRMGRWSGWAWGLGYAGGLVGLFLAIILNEKGEAFLGLDPSNFEPVRATFILAAVWYGLFSLPLFFKTTDRPSQNKTISNSIRDGFVQLKDSLTQLRKYKNILRFLIARLIYNDGVVTIFVVGGIYAAGTFDMTTQQVLYFGAGLNITAGIGAFGFAWLDDKSGSKKTIIYSIIGLLVPISALLFIQSITWFIIWGLILGVFVGPVQAASRTFMARLSPPELMTQMFGLYALSGKVTSFIGPFLVGLLTVQFGSQRFGMSAILVLLLIGLLLMFTVKEHEAPGIEINPEQI